MEENYPLVSIIIPVYNHEKYVKQTLDSILFDTYSSKELIIIDDGSTDNSVEVIEDWLVKNENKINFPVKFNSRPNKGLVKTLNEGLKIAKGKYYIPLASDDYLINNNTLQKRVKFLEKSSHFKAIFSDAYVVDSKNNLVYESAIEGLHKSPKQKLEEYLETDLILFWCVPGPVFMAETEYVRNIGGYKEGIIVEDRYIYLRILADKKLGFFNETVAAYRWHGENTCITNKDRILQDIIDTEKEMLDLFKSKQRLALYATILRREWFFQKDNNPTPDQIRLRDISLSIMDYLNGEASVKFHKDIERVNNINTYEVGE